MSCVMRCLTDFQTRNSNVPVGCFIGSIISCKYIYIVGRYLKHCTDVDTNYYWVLLLLFKIFECVLFSVAPEIGKYINSDAYPTRWIVLLKLHVIHTQATVDVCAVFVNGRYFSRFFSSHFRQKARTTIHKNTCVPSPRTIRKRHTAYLYNYYILHIIYIRLYVIGIYYYYLFIYVFFDLFFLLQFHLTRRKSA